MKTVNMHEAKTTLSKLVEAALAGEDVIIAKAGQPLVRLIPVPKPEPGRRAILGAMRDTIWLAPDWDEPDPELVNAFDRPWDGKEG
jgi:prevent-host-death family protein